MKYIYVFIAALLMSSCEKTLDDAVIPYVEQLVVFAIVEPGQNDLELKISKTLPVLGSSSPEDGQIDDVTGYISDGENTWNIEYRSDFVYVAKGFEGVAGRTYNLQLNWRGKKVESRTMIPEEDAIEASNYYIYESEELNWNDEMEINSYLMAHFKGSDRYVYTIGRDDIDSHYDRRYFILPEGRAVSQIAYLYSYFPEDTYPFRITITDIAYYDYLENDNGSNNDFDFFSIGGLNVDWNVEGDGIGMFVGRNYWRDTVHLDSIDVVRN